MEMDELKSIEIQNLGTNGEGVAKRDDLTVFVPFCLPGETVDIKLLKRKKNIAQGKLLRVIKSSKDRQVAPCPYFSVCGGCDLQHMQYKAQLEFKQNLVKNNFRKIGKIEVNVHDCVESTSQYSYRNKVSFPVCENGVGMFEEGSNKVVPIKSCLLAGDWTAKLIELFNKWFFDTKQTAYNRVSGRGLLRHLVARFENGTILVCLVASGTISNLYDFERLLKANYKKYGLFANKNTQKTAKIFSNNFQYISGARYIMVEEFGVRFPISIGSFEQVNTEIASMIYEKVSNEIAGERVVNAYSGAGLLSAILAKRAKEVIGIEIDINAHKNAEELKQLNDIINLENVCGDCGVELPKVGDFDCIVLDPPRSGCDRRVLETISKVAPQKIVYVSCDSATLARDVSFLSDYKIASVSPYDMFPETRHVETLCVLEKQ